MSSISLVSNSYSGPLPDAIELPEKDRPILLSAIAGHASHVITGDKDHFGAFYGRTILGVLILPPAAYLKRREELG
jgi:hypothetical protein